MVAVSLYKIRRVFSFLHKLQSSRVFTFVIIASVNFKEVLSYSLVDNKEILSDGKIASTNAAHKLGSHRAAYFK